MDSLFMVCPPDILNTMTTVNYAISTLISWFNINADTDILANS